MAVKLKPVILLVAALGLLAFLLFGSGSRTKGASENPIAQREQVQRELAERERAKVDAKVEESLHVLEDQLRQQKEANKSLKDTLEQLRLKRKDLVDMREEISRVRIEREAIRADLAAAKKQLADLKKEKSDLAKAPPAQANSNNNNNNHNNERNAQGLTKEEVKKLEDESFKKHWFNEYRSSLLPLNRTVPDIRIKECRPIQYDISVMPKTSVIICFVNEAWSALLRSVWSVLNRAPESLIHEVILVDDASDASWLGQNLLDYMKANWPAKVKYVRSDKRLGLIRARLMGAKAATGTVLTFLDSHIECNVAWLEPILDIIGKDRKTVVTPVIDTIGDKTMDYASWISQVPAVGTFSWTMDFTWKGGVIKPGDKPTDPIDSPTMAGGLFAIERDYFYEIGSYDEEMDGWGGENLEMSFRIWQCGGKLVTAPCSHIGHIFRESHPYTVPGSSIHHTFLKNSARVAEVWMDEYKKYFYQSRPEGEKIDIKDVSSRRALRERLQCKSFKWYMQTLLPNMFIPDDEHIVHNGALRAGDGQCLDKMGQRHGGIAGVYFCHNMGGNQAWMYTKAHEIRHSDDICLDSWASQLPGAVHMEKCHQMHGNQEWLYDEEQKTVKHKASGACLTSHVGSNGRKELKIDRCVAGSPAQTWAWIGRK